MINFEQAYYFEQYWNYETNEMITNIMFCAKNTKGAYILVPYILVKGKQFIFHGRPLKHKWVRVRSKQVQQNRNLYQIKGHS